MRVDNEIECCGMVLYKEDYSESDLRVVVVTDKFGILNFYIKGIRKTKKRDMAAVDVLNYSKFRISLKNDYYQLKEFELIECFDNIKGDLFKISCALYIADTVKKILPEGERRDREFNLILKTFYYFNKESSQEKILLSVAYFIFKIISMEGIVFEKVEDIIFSKDREKKEEIRVLEYFLYDKVAILLKDKLEKVTIFNVIEILERYLDDQLEIKLNLKKMIII